MLTMAAGLPLSSSWLNCHPLFNFLYYGHLYFAIHFLLKSKAYSLASSQPSLQSNYLQIKWQLLVFPYRHPGCSKKKWQVTNNNYQQKMMEGRSYGVIFAKSEQQKQQLWWQQALKITAIEVHNQKQQLWWQQTMKNPCLIDSIMGCINWPKTWFLFWKYRKSRQAVRWPCR